LEGQTERVRWRHKVTSRRPAADEDTEEVLWGNGSDALSVGDGLYEDGVETLTGHVQFAEVKRAILSLPEAQRTMVKLWSEGWSTAEIGKLCGTSKTWAHVQIQYALADLRRKLV